MITLKISNKNAEVLIPWLTGCWTAAGDDADFEALAKVCVSLADKGIKVSKADMEKVEDMKKYLGSPKKKSKNLPNGKRR